MSQDGSRPKRDVEKIDSHIHRKYVVGEKVGKGAYGIVWKAKNRQNNEYVAVKKVFDAFVNSQDSQRTFREIQILLHLDHPNIVKLQTFHKSCNDIDFYLVFEYVETDLHKVIKAGILEEIHQRFIIYQLLNTLNYLHDLNILHRDIKPSNLLLNSDCTIKVCDFGLARTIRGRESFDGDTVMTDYVATRWYRAPELLLGSSTYGKKVDIFAVGCILGEILKGEPLFAGTSTIDQLRRIVSITGKVCKKQLEAMSTQFAYEILSKINSNFQGGRQGKKKDLRLLFPRASEDALDLLDKLLKFDPRERFTAKQALNHRYVSIFNNSKSYKKFNLDLKTVRKIKNKIYFVLNDDQKLTKEEYRQRLYRLCRRKKKRRIKKRKAHTRARHDRPSVASKKM